MNQCLCKKCQPPLGIKMGVNYQGEFFSLDPCVYEEMEVHRNVTVVVKQCPKCGHVELEWHRQDDTEDEYIKELKEDKTCQCLEP